MNAPTPRAASRTSIESARTGPWTAPRPPEFAVPGVPHVVLSSVLGTPETACGADHDDAETARTRCRAEAVERATAWRPDRVGWGVAATSTYAAAPPQWFAQGHVAPSLSGHTVVVDEVGDDGAPAGRVAIDRAAVTLGTNGWFPAGSTGLAVAGSGADAVRHGAWEVLERDLLTRWWRGEIEADDVAGSLPAAPTGVRTRAVRVAEACTVVAAVDDRWELAAVGAAAGDRTDLCAAKARTEALISLAQLRHTLAHTEIATRTAPTVPTVPADRRGLDLPHRLFMSLADTLVALCDPRFAAAIETRFDAAHPVHHRASAQVRRDPVTLLHSRGHHVLVATLDSPEARWQRLAVRKVLASGVRTPLPRAAHPHDLPVPLV